MTTILCRQSASSVKQSIPFGSHGVQVKGVRVHVSLKAAISSRSLMVALPHCQATTAVLSAWRSAAASHQGRKGSKRQ